MASSERRPDDQFPMMMGRSVLEEYLGRKGNVIDFYIEQMGLSNAMIKLEGRDTVFIKPQVYKWLCEVGAQKGVGNMAAAQIGFVIVVGLIGGVLGWHASKGDLFD